MYERINEVYEKSLEKIKNFLNSIRRQGAIDKAVSDIIKVIDNNHEKSSWVNIAVLITNILGFAAYCVVSPVLAEYQREKGIRNFSMMAIAVIIGIIIWELVCIAGSDRLRALHRFLYSFSKKVLFLCQKYINPVIKVIGFLFAVFIILIVLSGEVISRLFDCIRNRINSLVGRHLRGIKWIILMMVVSVWGCLYFIPDVTYCTSVVEIYGIPTKQGEELKDKDAREKCAAYWKIEDYSKLKYMVLTYVEPYKQLDLMKENSTAYGMLFFQPTARIKIQYTKDKGKYLSLNQNSFEVAQGNGFREPVSIYYYSSNGKLTMQLEKNKYGKFDIIRYSSADMPQLLNSTLLASQDEEVIENSMTSQQIEITYNSEGLPETRRLSPYVYNSNGINGEYYVYDQNQRLTTLYYLDINGEFVRNKQGIMMIDFQYEDNGNLHSIRYYGGEDREKKTEGYQEVFCERFSYDTYGNLIERSQRDRNENLRSDVNGVCIYRYSYDYDTNSELRKEEFLGADGEPVQDKQFFSTSVGFEMSGGDGIGKRELFVSIDTIGSSSTVSNNSGVSDIEGVAYPLFISETKSSLEMEKQQNQTVSKLDSAQLQAEVEDEVFLKQKSIQSNEAVIMSRSGTQSNQILPVLQYGKWTEQEKKSENEDNIGVYLDEEADIIRNYVAIHYVIDKNGCISEKRYCNSRGELVACGDGYAIECFEYDEQRRITHKQYFDKNNTLCCINDGYAIVKNNYESDQNDNIESIEYLNINKKLVKNKELGYAYVKYTRIPEDKNKIIIKQYFDENGDLIRLPRLGYAMVKEYYDERNFLIWEAYYDDDEIPKKTCRVDYGVAEVWYEYEDSGNRIRELYKDEKNQIVNRSDTGYAAVYWKYEGGQIIDCHYEGNQDQMLRATVDRNTGIAGIKYTYESGRKVREEYYDTEGMPSFRTDIGCAAQVYEYNDRGKVCTESYYGLDGQAVLRKDTGYAIVAYQDNEYGQRISVRFYDTNKQLVVSADEHCAGYDYTYDSGGNRECVKCIGLDGALMTRRDFGYAQIHYKYDSDGNIIEGRYLDEEGELVIRKERGYAYYTSEYDDNGNWKESCYYSAEKKPVLRQDTGYFRIENEYYDDGKIKSQMFYGIDGKTPVISTEYCCAGFKYQYDYIYNNEFGFEYEENEKGVRKITTFIGLDGEPMIRRDLGYARVESVYDIEDNEISAVFYDSDGNVTVRKEGGYAAFRSKYENGKWMKCQYYDIDGGLTLRNDTGYAVIINEYDEYGQRIKESYHNEYDKPTISTKYHCASFIFGYDGKGNKTQVKYLDTDDRMMVRRDLGYAQMTIGYDSIGNKVSEAYFDTKGKPAVWKEGGYASYISEYDNVKWMETRYYDKKGRLTLRNDKGYAVVKNEYDEYGQRILQTYYDASDALKPIISKEHHCAGFQYEYDEMGNRVYIGYLDMDGKLMVRRDLGYAQVAMEYDHNGNKMQEAYFDVWGNPAIDKKGGYSYNRNCYDEKGRLKEVEYFINRNVRNKVNIAYDQMRTSVEDGKDSIDETGKEGELVLRKDMGYAKVEYDYDDFGQKIRSFYYGADRKPIITTKYLCAGFEYKYDEKGNQTDIYYLGLEEENIVRRDLGIAHIQQKYDILGNLERELYFDSDGPTTYKKYGYASYKQIFKNGKVTEIWYLDAAGDPVIHGEKGYAIVRYEYDELGQCISEFYYGADKQPIISKEYYCAGFQYEYDEVGNLTDSRYVDTEGNCIIRWDLGYAHVHSEYDECGNTIGDFYYDAEDNPTISKTDGNASCEYIYDRGNCVEWRYFDRQGNPMQRWGSYYATIRYKYDDYGQCIGEAYYDAKGDPIFRADYQCAGCRYGYDERGNQTDFWCIGLDGNPMMRKDLGYAQRKSEFDAFNNMTKEVYLDVDDQPVVLQELGYAQICWEYNELGKVEKEAYFDADDQAVIRTEGKYAYCMFYYDDEKHWEERRYFDVDNNLTLRNDEGYAIIRYSYDEFGQCTVIDYMGKNREPVINFREYCASVSYEYDERGNNTYIWYWNSDGEVAERKDIGIAMEEIIYDQYGYIISREYYKVDPENDSMMTWTIRKDLGYACVDYVYERNVCVRTEYFDVDGNYIVPKDIGYAIYECEYNDMWQLSRELYYGIDEELINYVDGKAAIVEYTYSSWGFIEQRTYYDKMGIAF